MPTCDGDDDQQHLSGDGEEDHLQLEAAAATIVPRSSRYTVEAGAGACIVEAEPTDRAGRRPTFGVGCGPSWWPQPAIPPTGVGGPDTTRPNGLELGAAPPPCHLGLPPPLCQRECLQWGRRGMRRPIPAQALDGLPPVGYGPYTRGRSEHSSHVAS